MFIIYCVSFNFNLHWLPIYISDDRIEADIKVIHNTSQNN